MFKLNCYSIVKMGILTALLATLSSCAVVMAAKKTGTSLDRVQGCNTRGQLLSFGPTIISSDTLPTGELIEIYQFTKEKGSAARAFMHGVLDVSTCGIWEVVGTPIEACENETEYFLLKIFYDCKGYIQKIELL